MLKPISRPKTKTEEFKLDYPKRATVGPRPDAAALQLEHELSLNPDDARKSRVELIDRLWERVKAQNTDQTIRAPESLHSRIIEYFKKCMGKPEEHFRKRVDLSFADEEAEADGILHEGMALRIIEVKRDHNEIDRAIGQLLRYRTLFIQRYGGKSQDIKLGLVCTGITPAQHAACHELDIKLWLYGHVMEHCSLDILHIQYPDSIPWNIIMGQALFETCLAKSRRRYPHPIWDSDAEPEPAPDDGKRRPRTEAAKRRRALKRMKLNNGYQMPFKIKQYQRITSGS